MKLLMTQAGQRVEIEPAHSVPFNLEEPMKWAERTAGVQRASGGVEFAASTHFFADHDLGDGARVKIIMSSPGGTSIMWGRITWEDWNRFTWEEV